MLHRYLFRPKWQHRNPRIRLAGVLELPPGDPRLSELAKSDPDVAVRRQAVRRLTELAELDDRRANDADPSVREAAHKRLCQALSGEEEVGLGAAELEAAACELMDDPTALYLVHHAGSEAIRLAALARTDRHAILAEVALADPSPALRTAALERIDHLPTLERLARMARGRDKRVARMAREKIDTLRAAEERPRRQREVCEGLERLVAGGVPDIVRFHDLATTWTEVGEGAPEDLAARVQAARTAFERLDAQHREVATRLARQRELCDRAESLAAEVRALTVPVAGELASSRKALEMLKTSWRTLAEEGGEVSATCAARFAAAVSVVSKRLPALEGVIALHQQFEELADKAQRLAEGAAIPVERRLRDLEERWRDVTGQHRNALLPQTRERFDAAVGRARERMQQAREKERSLTAEFDGLIAELASALEAGELQHAISLHDKAGDRLDKLVAVAPRQEQRRKRLHRISAPLREMRDWRRYGVAQVRDELIRRMRGLIDVDLPPSRLATEIRGLQEEWRSLDRKSGPAAEVLWEAFSVAAREARRPCDAHFAELAAEHRANAEARATFCDDLEASLADTDREEPDWAALDRQIHAARTRWRELGGVQPGQWQSLDKRFRDIIRRFEERLAPERERERQRRERLIAHVEALADEPDLRKAVAEAKAAQAAWHPTVPASRKIEQALWKRFRAASDAIFARRDADRAEHRRDVEEQTAAREALCEAAEALTVGEPESWVKARAECEALRAAWAELPAPPRQKGAIERRFDAAVAAFRRAEQAARTRAASEEEDRWAERARLCAGLEAQLDTGAADGACDEASRRWAALPPLADEALQGRFEDRFSRICRALAGDTAQRDALESEQDACLVLCRQLCLELEILAGIESPPEFAEDRLALQVERLPQAMMSGSGRAREREQEFRAVLRDCLLAGPVPGEAGESVFARVERARQAMAGAAAATTG